MSAPALPSLFISHGSPMFALLPGIAGPALRRLGETLPRPRAIVVMSPHWMTRSAEVLSGPAPETIHDFGGFPAELYTLSYPAPGAPGVAAEVIGLLGRHGIPAVANDRAGRDHGAWVPLMHLYPEADIPLLQVAQPATRSPEVVFEFGRALAPLREQGVLLIGSGSLTHNLYELRRGDERADTYATAFADWIWNAIEAGDLEALLDYRRRAPEAVRAHPTDEHLLPLYFAIGAAGKDWQQAARIAGGVTNGVLSMDSFAFGRHATAGSETAPLAA